MFFFTTKKVVSLVALFTANLNNDYSSNGSIDVLDRRPVNFSVFLKFSFNDNLS